MSRAARLAGLVLAAGMTASVAALSRVSVDAAGADGALLRLSWKMSGEVVEACRQLSPEELERLPVHMRNPDACEGRATAYRLMVDVDGRRRAERRIGPAGLRGDRPVTVLEEVALTPGRHELRVVFEPAEAEATSEPLVFEGVVAPDVGDVVLVTLDDREGRLEATGPGR